MQDLVGQGMEFGHYHGDKEKPLQGINKGKMWSDLWFLLFSPLIAV